MDFAIHFATWKCNQYCLKYMLVHFVLGLLQYKWPPFDESHGRIAKPFGVDKQKHHL
jgi:hypothetical protein